MKVNSAFDLLVKTKVEVCETAMQDHTLQTWFQNIAKKKQQNNKSREQNWQIKQIIESEQ